MLFLQLPPSGTIILITKATIATASCHHGDCWCSFLTTEQISHLCVSHVELYVTLHKSDRITSITLWKYCTTENFHCQEINTNFTIVHWLVEISKLFFMSMSINFYDNNLVEIFYSENSCFNILLIFSLVIWKFDYFEIGQEIDHWKDTQKCLQVDRETKVKETNRLTIFCVPYSCL